MCHPAGQDPGCRAGRMRACSNVRSTAAHCVHITDADMELLADKRVTAVHNPVSNLKLASGVARVKDMLDRNVRVALGTDSVLLQQQP